MNPKENSEENNPVSEKETLNLLTEIPSLNSDGTINVVIEIPAGTLEKFEVDKVSGRPKIDTIDGKPRIVNYLSYPGNYGMIPQTLLSRKSGGDGDPLDVIVIGASVARGSVVKAKLIGVLLMLDRNEQDDKLIAVMEGSPLFGINSLEELNENYKGITEILQLWFGNYKGGNIVQIKGFGDKVQAITILEAAIEGFRKL